MLSRNQAKWIISLRRKRERESSGCFLAEGLRLCEEAARSDWGIRLCVFRGDLSESERGRRLLAKLHERGVPLHEVPEKEMARVATTVHAQGVLVVVERRRTSLESLSFGAGPLVVTLDGVRDPGNVGTIIRAADWFAADAVLLCAGCADLYNPKTVRATAGALFHVPVVTRVSLPKAIARLRGDGFQSFAGTLDGKPWWEEWAGAESRLLVLGSEARGVSEGALAAVEARVSVPGLGRAESLNVAIAAGVLLAAARGKPGDR